MKTLVLGLLLLAPAGEVLTGTLERLPLEGGVWILDVGKTRYDLHQVPEGFKAGGRVEVTGRILKDGKCIHQCGVIVDVESLRTVK